jgi:asparagine synthase (glutamine-hydrolysing)
MCGITGILHAQSGVKRNELQDFIEKMATRLFHRGPDDAGTYVDEAAGLALGFRRLAILDLSADGHQPMRSRGGRFTIVFNGEIYNYLQLADELKQGRGDAIFRGHSDTEVMLEAIERWGLEAAVKRLQGMFAFALWDAEWSTLHLVRDRMGEKPLYYGQFGDTFLFGSELKALRAHPAFRGAVDHDSVLPYLAYGYIPGSRSIYEGVSKIQPGSILRVRPSAGGFEVSASAYWTARSAGEQTTGAQDRSAAEQTERLDHLLREVIAQQMISDVPLGAFLSGGIDSSTVVGIMQSLSPRPIKTFTVGFEEDRFCEAKHAKAVANYLGTAHTELTVSAADALNVIPRLPAIYDEPFADPSQIPTLLVSKLARTEVTVSLSGDGADELFGGYTRYRRAVELWTRFQGVHRTARVPLGKALTKFPRIERPSGARVVALGELLSRSANPDAFYETFAATDWQPHRTLAGKRRGRPAGFGAARPSSPDLLRRFMQADMMAYLPDDILVKVDRASMAFSLESRAPFLDVRIVEFAAGLPSSMLVRGDQGKWLLRQVLHKYVPRELVERPKMGFGIPLADWLRGPLRGWAEELLSEDALTSTGIFDARRVRRVWSEHLAQKHSSEYRLWNILMLQAWLEAQRTA